VNYRKMWLSCLAAGMVAAPSFTAGAGEPEKSDAAATTADEAVEQFVCRYERPTGSRKSVKVCRAKSAIEEDADGSRGAVDRIKHYANPAAAPPSG
jgi:hypothetical protein